MRLLICGGRDYCPLWAEAMAFLDAFEMSLYLRVVDTVISGGARGADAVGESWARYRGKQLVVFKADWTRYGNKAGPIRNQQMLDEGKPEAVFAFPGGRGTDDMIRRAKKAGIPVYRDARGQPI